MDSKMQMGTTNASVMQSSHRIWNVGLFRLLSAMNLFSYASPFQNLPHGNVAWRL